MSCSCATRPHFPVGECRWSSKISICCVWALTVVSRTFRASGNPPVLLVHQDDALVRRGLSAFHAPARTVAVAGRAGDPRRNRAAAGGYRGCSDRSASVPRRYWRAAPPVPAPPAPPAVWSSVAVSPFAQAWLETGAAGHVALHMAARIGDRIARRHAVAVQAGGDAQHPIARAAASGRRRERSAPPCAFDRSWAKSTADWSSSRARAGRRHDQPLRRRMREDHPHAAGMAHHRFGKIAAGGQRQGQREQAETKRVVQASHRTPAI